MPKTPREAPQKIAGDLHKFPVIKDRNFKRTSGDHLRDTRLESKNAYGADFDGTCDIQSPKYKTQAGPMKNPVAKGYSLPGCIGKSGFPGDIEARYEAAGEEK